MESTMRLILHWEYRWIAIKAAFQTRANIQAQARIATATVSQICATPSADSVLTRTETMFLTNVNAVETSMEMDIPMWMISSMYLLRGAILHMVQPI